MEKQIEELIIAIRDLTDTIENAYSTKGQMGYTIADSLEEIALTNFRRYESEEEQNKKVASATR